MSIEATQRELPLTERQPTRRAAVLAATGLATSMLVAILTIIPAPYAIGEPGPTFDTLSEVNGTPLVDIQGAPTYEASGELRLTTVSVSRGSQQPFTVGRVIAAFFSSSEDVLPEELVFGDPRDEDSSRDQSQQQWISSQEAATVSALEALGTQVSATLRVAGVDPTSKANGLLEEGDEITAIDGRAMTSYTALANYLDGLKPGDTVTVGIERDGLAQDVSFDLLKATDGTAMMGIWIDPVFDLPIDVKVQIDSVGGPSAGMMFALAIMDRLTPEDELGGKNVAGTGTIDIDGSVGPIGGIQLKLHGARKAGADYFLAPVENCDSVVGHVPSGLAVYAVDNLEDAYAAILAIGQGDTSHLPTCETQVRNAS